MDQQRRRFHAPSFLLANDAVWSCAIASATLVGASAARVQLAPLVRRSVAAVFNVATTSARLYAMLVRVTPARFRLKWRAGVEEQESWCLVVASAQILGPPVPCRACAHLIVAIQPASHTCVTKDNALNVFRHVDSREYAVTLVLRRATTSAAPTSLLLVCDAAIAVAPVEEAANGRILLFPAPVWHLHLSPPFVRLAWCQWWWSATARMSSVPCHAMSASPIAACNRVVACLSAVATSARVAATLCQRMVVGPALLSVTAQGRPCALTPVLEYVMQMRAHHVSRCCAAHAIAAA